MDHPRKPMRGKERLDAGTIFEIEFGELKLGMGPELSEAGLFQADIIIGIQIIQPKDAITAFQQPSAEMKADKPCGACDQYQPLRG